jgi:TRAP-type C4-dicarboxylate transport system substrate-binding protein
MTRWFPKALVVAGLGLLCTAAAHAETFTLRMGGGHPPGLTYIAVYDGFFANEVVKRVKEKTGHELRFIKAWGGSVAKVDGVIEAVQKGSLDIGLSPIGFEQTRAGLLNYSAYMPFTAADPLVQHRVASRMLREVPALQASMKPFNAHVLASMVTEAYGLTTRFEWSRIEELRGRRLAMTGTNAPLFLPLGAVPVTLGIGEHYQALQNSLAEGSLFFISGMEAFKLSEVAKVFTKTGFGSLSTLVAFMNMDTRARLPKAVLAIIDQVSEEAAQRVAELSKQRDDEVEGRMKAAGIKVNELALPEQRRWAEQLRELPARSAKELDAKGQPGTAVLKRYVEMLRDAGYRFPVDYEL